MKPDRNPEFRTHSSTRDCRIGLCLLDYKTIKPLSGGIGQMLFQLSIV